MENNKTNLIYPELSYKIIGVAFDIFNDLGFGHKEIYYQRAFAKKLEKLGISFEREKDFLFVMKVILLEHTYWTF